jgi:FAD/FMN-containing dehydrogenase
VSVTISDSPATPPLDGLTGRLVTSADPDYDDLRTVVFPVDARPALIARVRGAQDVARVIAYARETGLELAVRSGGHSTAGHGTSDGGIVIDMREMKALEIDPQSRTAWAEAGLTAAEYGAAAAEHGLATGFGDTGSVGIGGITLGGGIGYLSRKLGLTIDSLLAVEIVTADGLVLHVDDSYHPDLFWAIRGGGGNFGVVTRFHYRLHEVPQVLGGMIVLPATPEVVAGFISLSQAAPDELTTIANVMNCPPMPFVPEEHHGSLVVLGMLCHAGDAESAERDVAQFRALAQPVADMLRQMPYPEMFPPDDPDYHPTAVATNLFLESIGEREAATIIEYLGASDASMRVAQLRVHGGAIARVPSDATAFAHRRAPIMANLAAFYEGPEDRPQRQAWLDEFVGVLRQGDDGVYVNFLADEGQERVRAAYPGATWDRLRAIKARYDPDHRFRRNQNVPAEA